MRVEKLSRRKVMAAGAAVGLVGAPFVRSANAAGTISIGMWDHWVPGANDVQTAIIKEWADKNKVEVKIDYITSQGNKLLLTLQAEAELAGGIGAVHVGRRERRGHDRGGRERRRLEQVAAGEFRAFH